MPSLYDTTIPVFIHFLNNLDFLLKEAEKHADDTGTPHSKILEDRLAPDMLGFIFQNQMLCNISKNMVKRIGGFEPAAVPDEEKTFEDLHKRLQGTIEVLKKVDKKTMDGKEDADVTVPIGQDRDPLKFTGASYVLYWVIPNFFFHATTAHDILRKNGVQIGKVQFLAGAGKPGAP